MVVAQRTDEARAYAQVTHQAFLMSVSARPVGAISERGIEIGA